MSEIENNETVYEAVREYFHQRKLNYKLYGSQSLMGELLRRLSDIYGLTHAEACQVLTEVVTGHLYQRFSRPQFLTMSDSSRNAWLRSLLLKSPKGLALMTEAVETCFPNRLVEVDEAWEMAYTTKEASEEVARTMRSIRRERKAQSKRATAKETASQPSQPPKPAAPDPRQYHPMGSPHEWAHPATKVRYYDDPTEGVVAIPYFAPPRPTAQATWHLLRKVWMQDGAPIDEQGCYLLAVSCEL